MRHAKTNGAKNEAFVQYDESGAEYAAGEVERVLSKTVPPSSTGSTEILGFTDAEGAAPADAFGLDGAQTQALPVQDGVQTQALPVQGDAQTQVFSAQDSGQTQVLPAQGADQTQVLPVQDTDATIAMSAAGASGDIAGSIGGAVRDVEPNPDTFVPESAWEPTEVPVAGVWEGAPAQAAGAKPKRHGVAKAVGTALLVVLALIGAVYAAGAVYFAGHTYPNTIMGTEDISLKNESQIADIVESVVGNYTVTTTGAGTHFAFSMKDAGVQVDGTSVADKALRTYSAWRWPLEFMDAHDVTEAMTNAANASGLEQLVRDTVAAYNEDGTDPVNATIVYDSEAKAYVVQPEKPGTKLDADKVLQAVDAAVAIMSPSATLGEDDYLRASVTQDDPQLREAAETASSYVQASIDLVLGTDATPAGTINADQISQWVGLGEGGVTFNEEAMNTWLKEYADGMDTIGTERTYTRPDGATFTVSGGTYGWEVDSQSLVDQVREAIVSGSQVTITVPTFSEGAIYPAAKGQPDWGKYVDVSLGEQHARCYDASGNLIWESDVVTGIPDEKHFTPTGIYQLFNKESPATLKGEIQEATGQPEYETKVAYWMPFTYQGHGFHDATWQPAFGGARYAEGWGSHGCVNLPYDKAEELYSLIDIGNAVIIHE